MPQSLKTMQKSILKKQLKYKSHQETLFRDIRQAKFNCLNKHCILMKKDKHKNEKQADM